MAGELTEQVCSRKCLEQRQYDLPQVLQQQQQQPAKQQFKKKKKKTFSLFFLCVCVELQLQMLIPF